MEFLKKIFLFFSAIFITIFIAIFVSPIGLIVMFFKELYEKCNRKHVNRLDK